MDNTTLSKFERDLERQIYEESYYEFFKVAFCQLHPSTAYDENWHAKYICDILQEEVERIIRKEPRKHDIIINVPFRSAKSMISTVIFPVWAWTRDASLKFFNISYSGPLALEHSMRSRDLIDSVWFQRLYGNTIKLRADKNAASHYETLDKGMRKAVGTGGQITGSGADIILVDDPQDPKKAASEVERKNTIEFYDHTLFSRLNEPDIGVRIIIQQRLHEQDLTGHLMDSRTGRPNDHKHICIPGELDKTVLSPPELEKHYTNGLFWPTRFSNKTLDSYKKALGSLQYAGQMGQRPVPPEGNLFKRKWFEIVEPESIQRDATVSPIKFVVDTAYTENEMEKNDPNGFLSAFKKDNDIYIANFTEAWLEFPQLLDFLKKYVQLNGYDYQSLIKVEPKASGKSVVQSLKTTELNIVEVEGEWIKDDKVTRANGISPICQAGKVKLIKGDWNEKFLAQLTSFPRATHDEAVDCLVYILNEMCPLSEFLSVFL